MTNWAVITTLNEQTSIASLVGSLRALELDVVVIDDGSDDETVYGGREAGAYVIAHTLRVGIGPSLVEGWRFALKRGAERVVQLDAGGSHNPNDAIKLLARLNFADVVIGSRFLPGSIYEGNIKRAAMSRLASTACNAKAFHRPSGISDWTSGYRAFDADSLEKLSKVWYSTTMHSWQIEVLQAAMMLKMSIAEVPITYDAGRSSFNRRIAREAFDVWYRPRLRLVEQAPS